MNNIFNISHALRIQKHMKIIKSLPVFYIATIACLTSACSTADESLGTLTANIDGEDYSSITLAPVGERTGSASFSSIGPMTNISIQGHDLDTGGMMDNVLTLSISLMGTDQSAQIMEAKISYWPKGMKAPFYNSEQSGTPVKLEWESLSLSDDARAKGSFSGEICLQKDFFTAVDTSQCKPISGNFATDLIQQN